MSVYESDYGVCRIVLSRYVPADAVIFLDSTKVAVVPLAGRSFQYKALAVTGDYVSGEMLGRVHAGAAEREVPCAFCAGWRRESVGKGEGGGGGGGGGPPLRMGGVMG